MLIPRLPQVSFASSVISARRTLDTGQLCSASRARLVNFSSLMPGTCARSVNADQLILKPCAPSGSRVTAASVANCAGLNPAICRAKARAIVKQPA